MRKNLHSCRPRVRRHRAPCLPLVFAAREYLKVGFRRGSGSQMPSFIVGASPAGSREKNMAIRTFLLTVSVLVLSSLVSLGQNNCSGSPAYGTCKATAPPVQVWCAGNNSSSSCRGGTAWVGFDTTSPAAGSWLGQFEGVDASS